MINEPVAICPNARSRSAPPARNARRVLGKSRGANGVRRYVSENAFTVTLQNVLIDIAPKVYNLPETLSWLNQR